ncbi:hypothetical protein [Nocardia sp. NPDC046763]|uniref:hypothetical protein n=1 Tax=Nocardia sp. NPDC046763 TaxID=3155256 RepID=UPI0033C0FFFF
MRTMIELEEISLAPAAAELGTTTVDDTVNAALWFVAQRKERIERLLKDPTGIGGFPRCLPRVGRSQSRHARDLSQRGTCFRQVPRAGN